MHRGGPIVTNWINENNYYLGYLKVVFFWHAKTVYFQDKRPKLSLDFLKSDTESVRFCNGVSYTN